MKTVFIPIALTLATALAGCGVGEASLADADTSQAATPVPVVVASPTRGDIFANYRATATLASDADAPVPARVPGEVVEILVEEGQHVEQNQVLARLDGERLRLEMVAARADLDKVRGELERYRDLAGRGLVSAAMFDGLKYDVDALEAAYKLKKLNYDYSNIRAPIAGIVSSRDIKPGQHVKAGDVTFRITDNSKLVAYLQIPQSELVKFSREHSATVEVDSSPGAVYPATIVRISPTIDTRNGTFRATARIDNPRGELVAGMFARFTVAYEKHEDALLIPQAALVDEDNEISVYVVNNGEVTRRVIETGITSDDRVEVLGGLGEGEQVVVVGQSGLRDGSKVLASNRKSDSAAG
jgi:membrane fusion protein, multidrug efflux system